MTQEIVMWEIVDGSVSRIVASVHAIHQRTDLLQVQAALAARHHFRGAVCCGCRRADGVVLVMEVYLRQSDGIFRLKRFRITDAHHPLCIWRLPDSPCHPTELRDNRTSAHLFDSLPTHRRVALWAQNDDPTSERIRREAISFYRFGSRACSEGLVAAWREGCARGLVDPECGSAPDATLVARGINWHFWHDVCVEGCSAMELAGSMGVQLVHGIVFDDTALDLGHRPKETDTPILLSCFTRRGNEHGLKNRWFTAPAPVIEFASTPLRTVSSWVRAPYYFVGVAESTGRLRRLALYPVHFDLKNLCFVDSGMERAYAAELLGQRVCVIKPPENSVIPQLATIHPRLAWLASIPRNQLNDFLTMRGAENRVIELAGFDRRKLSYRWHLNEKRRKSVAVDRPYHFEIVEGATYGRRLTPPLDFQNARLPLWH